MSSPTADEQAVGSDAMIWKQWGVVAAILLLILAIIALTFRPLSDLIYRMEGYVVIVDHPVRTMVAQPGEMASAAFPVRNVTREGVKILGAETHCGCAAVTNLPLTIPPGEWRDLKFRVETSLEDAGMPISQDARLYIDRASPPVVLQINVQVTKSLPASGPDARPASRKNDAGSRVASWGSAPADAYGAR